MSISKRKKRNRLRGYTTHGYGSMKKHRGSGHRGGTGNAGTGKRADSKKPAIWKGERYFGKHGFKRKNSLHIEAVNIEYLEQNFGKLGADIKLKEFGFDKLIGGGKPSRAYNIVVDYASKGAIEKIEKAGGKVTLKAPTAPKEKPIVAVKKPKPIEDEEEEPKEVKQPAKAKPKKPEAAEESE